MQNYLQHAITSITKTRSSSLKRVIDISAASRSKRAVKRWRMTPKFGRRLGVASAV